MPSLGKKKLKYKKPMYTKPKHLSGIYPSGTINLMKVVADVEATIEKTPKWISLLESKNPRSKDHKTPGNRDLFQKTTKEAFVNLGKKISINKETFNIDSGK